MNNTEEYGKETNLTELLEELALYCATQGYKGDLDLILPRKVIDKYSLTFTPKQRVQSVRDSDEYYQVASLYVSSGKIRLFSKEKNEVVPIPNNKGDCPICDGPTRQRRESFIAMFCLAAGIALSALTWMFANGVIH